MSPSFLGRRLTEEPHSKGSDLRDLRGNLLLWRRGGGTVLWASLSISHPPDTRAVGAPPSSLDLLTILRIKPHSQAWPSS